MIERRNSDRVRVYYYLKIYNGDTHEDAASVVDMSESGMKVLSESPMVEGHKYSFLMKLPRGYITEQTFPLEVIVQWCNFSPQQNLFESGLSFASLNTASQRGLLIIRNIVSDFRKNGLLQ